MISSAEEFTALRSSDDPNEYHREAHDCASEEVWQEVIEGWPDMRRWVAHNKTIPQEIQERLSRDADGSVRAGIARKNCVSSELMLRLSEDSEEEVRARIVYNKNATRSVLERLRYDPVVEIAAKARARLEGNQFREARDES